MRSIAYVLLLFLLSSSTEFLMGNGTWAVFDISSQEQDLVVVRLTLVKFRLYPLSEGSGGASTMYNVNVFYS